MTGEACERTICDEETTLLCQFSFDEMALFPGESPAPFP
jgi:hypothetical protein